MSVSVYSLQLLQMFGRISQIAAIIIWYPFVINYLLNQPLAFIILISTECWVAHATIAKALVTCPCASYIL